MQRQILLNARGGAIWRKNENFLWERRRSSRHTSGLWTCYCCFGVRDHCEVKRSLFKSKEFLDVGRGLNIISWPQNYKVQSFEFTAGAIKARIFKTRGVGFGKKSGISFGQAWLVLWQGRCLLRHLFCFCLNLWYFHRSSKLGVWWIVSKMAINFSTTRATTERVQIGTIHVRSSRAVLWRIQRVAAFASVQTQHQLTEKI